MKRSMALLLATSVLVVVPTTAEASDAQRTRTVPGHFTYLTSTSYSASGDVVGCGWGIGVSFPAVAGATGYDVAYYDGYWKQVEHATVDPKTAQHDTSEGVPESTGTLFAGVTGGGYSPPCEGAGDPTEGGRFSKGAAVTVLFAKDRPLVSGHVFRCTPTVDGCLEPHGRAGIRVTASKGGKVKATAWTSFDGSWRMVLPSKGSWTFKAKDTEKDRLDAFVREPGTVSITRDTANLTFVGYSSSQLLPPPKTLFAGAPPGTVGAVVEVRSLDKDSDGTLYVKRGKAAPAVLLPGELVQPGDVLSTDDHTVAAIELPDGGRVGLNKGAEITVDGTRDIKGGSEEHGFTTDKGTMWAKVGELKDRLDVEVDTQAGIKG